VGHGEVDIDIDIDLHGRTARRPKISSRQPSLPEHKAESRATGGAANLRNPGSDPCTPQVSSREPVIPSAITQTQEFGGAAPKRLTAQCTRVN
jgi:hypothetical protein